MLQIFGPKLGKSCHLPQSSIFGTYHLFHFVSQLLPFIMLQNVKKTPLDHIPGYKVAKFWTQIRPKLPILLLSNIFLDISLMQFLSPY